MRKQIVALAAVFCTLAVTLTGMPEAAAHHKNEQKVEKILYIPHDNRPISDKQTAEVISKLGYEVVVPPDNMLGSRTDLGHPDELWDWLKQNAQDADAAVISSDSMLYGSLVGSRKHEYSKKEVLVRADRFQSFRKEHPKMELYVFGSIMRTPRSGEASGHEEPGYYRNYGADIFRYTVLKDKEEMEGLTRREKKEYDFLQRLIPKASLADWMGRREKNFAANEKMIDLTRKNAFNYFVLGRDDNAPYSQTHLESRHLAAAGQDLGKTRFQAMAGIDEIGMLLLTRAVNDMRRDVPFVYVRYNWGKGEFTVPSYSDEKIGDSIAAAITAAGGMQVKSPEKADLVLTVNTNPNGKTYEANDRANDGTPREGTKYFAIRCVSENKLALFVDDITYHEGQLTILNYNVYRNGEKIGTANANATSFSDAGNDGDIYTITIVYDEGESTFSNEAGITLGVEELTQGRLNVMTGRGTVTVSNANGSDVTILTTDGRQVAKADNVDKKTFHVQRGTYLVRVAEHVFHVVVK